MAKLTLLITAALSALTLPHSAAAGKKPDKFTQSCAALTKTFKAENVTPLYSEYLARGTTLSPSGVDPSCGDGSTPIPADLCRLGLNVRTSDRSEVLVEVFLPRKWDGRRFLATGNGGIGGCVAYSDMAYGASLGFATTGSNNGHHGQNGTTFLNNLDVVADYSYRAVTTSTEIGQEVVKHFYGEEHNKAYYLGCSTGGRQGFKMAQDYPDIFDGIVAGAPAFNFQALTSWSGAFHTIIKNAGPDGVPPQASFAAIDAEMLRQCDHLDGAVDGILEDPSLCNFRPEALICKPGETPGAACISGKQAETVRKFLSPLYGKDGTWIYPRLEPTPGFMGFITGAYGPAQFLYTDHWFKYAVYNDPTFDTSSLGPEDWARAIEDDPTGVRTWSGDLSGVRDKGAKVLHYHGQEDVIISAASSNAYYDLVGRTMNLPESELDKFYRFFRVSGMGHCSGGAGASNIGNRLGSAASDDHEDNVLMALVRWVEKGKAPEVIRGSKWKGTDRKSGVDYERAHCKYPLRNELKKGGKAKKAKDWKCVL